MRWMLLVDLGLTDALELVLDRVLDGEDVEVGRVDLGQRRVQGGASFQSRSGPETSRMPWGRRMSLRQVLPARRAAMPEAVEGEHLALLEDTHHDALAVAHG